MRVAGILTVVFLAPTFVQRLFIGGEADSYDQLSGFSLAVLGYFSHIAIALSYLIMPAVPGQSSYIINRWMPIAAFSAGHAFMLVLEGQPGGELGLLSIGRHLLWLFACLAISRMTTAEELLQRLVQFTHATFLIVFLTYVIYKISGFPLQILLSNGEPRAQALLTEPSGVGCLIAGYVGLAIWEGRWRRIVPAAAVVIMAYSVIGMFGFFAGLTFGLARRLARRRSVRRATVLLTLYLLPLAFIVVGFLAEPISAAAREVLQATMGSSLQENFLYSGFGERALQALSVLDYAKEMVAGSEDVTGITGGGIFRLAAVWQMLDQLKHSYHLWFGYGLGAHAQLMLASLGTILDFGLLPMLLSSFGLIGGLAVFSWLIVVLSRSESALTTYAVPFTAISLLNSAGGIHMYSIVLVSAFLMERAHHRLWPPGRSALPSALAAAQHKNL